MSSISISSVIQQACINLNRSESTNNHVAYLETEWIHTWEDLLTVHSNNVLWASIKLPARLKSEIEIFIKKEKIEECKLLTTGTDHVNTNIHSTGGVSPISSTVGSPKATLSHEHERKMLNRLSLNIGDNEDCQERSKVVVRVPATSANLGPGFDCIGMAVDMWSEFTVERADAFGITSEGEGIHDMPMDNTNLVCFGVAAAFKHAGKELPILRYHLKNNIPYARGLGSSSAAIVGGLVAGLVLAGHQVKTWGAEELLNMAADIEGHPDNVAPAIYGGIQLGIHTGKRWMSERVNIPPGIQCVCFIPEIIGKTSTARNILPDTVTRQDAIYNISRTAWLINALASNNIDKLYHGVEDVLHQPQRGNKVYSHLYPILQAATQAGANAAYLSGAGPSVMALTSGASGDIFTQRDKERVDRNVAEAILKVAKECNIKGEVIITSPVQHGAYVISAEPPLSHGQVRYPRNI